MFNIGFAELIIVLLIAFLVVGPKDLPKVARWLGRNVRRAKKLIRELKKELGWDELQKEFNDVSADVKQTVKESDITEEIRSTSADLKRSINEIKKNSSLKPGQKQGGDQT